MATNIKSKPWLIVVSRQFSDLNEDDQLLYHALAHRGLPVQWTYWDSEFPWETAEVVIIRSTWDYSQRFAEFSSWLGIIESKTKVINPVPLVLWNADKRYLSHFRKAGTRVIDTHYFNTTKSALDHVLSQNQPCVVKPSISAGGRNTFRIFPDTSCNELSEHMNTIVNFCEIMVQPYIQTIETLGEVSLAVIDGEVTHAASKFPQRGGFLVQPHNGGSETPKTITPLDREWAQMVLDACPQSPIYARLDYITLEDGERLLVEAELIEPDLFLRFSQDSAQRFAKAIENHLAHA